MTLLMKLIFPRMMCPIPFMNVRVPEPAPSSSAAFPKNAGFTGVRLGFTVVPKDLKDGDVALHSLWARRHGTKYNGAPYIIQRAGEAVYSPEGKAQLKEQVAYYMRNARVIYDGLKSAGYQAVGGVNAPYIWLKTPEGMDSWQFFDHLLEDVNVVGTPGSGFGPSGEGYFRLTAFGTYEKTVEASSGSEDVTAALKSRKIFPGTGAGEISRFVLLLIFPALFGAFRNR